MICAAVPGGGKTIARVILAALWLLAASMSTLCPGESVAQKLNTVDFIQILQMSRILCNV
jgi:hypothetical protein